jgi:hypothetical protein
MMDGFFWSTDTISVTVVVSYLVPGDLHLYWMNQIWGATLGLAVVE